MSRSISLWAAVVVVSGFTGCTRVVDVPPVHETGADPFHRTLAEAYSAEGNRKTDRGDWRDAAYFNARAFRAAVGRADPPQDPYLRRLPVPAKVEVYNAYARLRTAINRGAPVLAPVEAADAQVMYDCWIEAEEAGVAGSINRCRSGYYRTIELVESTLAERLLGGSSGREAGA